MNREISEYVCEVDIGAGRTIRVWDGYTNSDRALTHQFFRDFFQRAPLFPDAWCYCIAYGELYAYDEDGQNMLAGWSCEMPDTPGDLSHRGSIYDVYVKDQRWEPAPV